MFKYVCYSLNSLTGLHEGIIQGNIIELIKGNISSLGYSLHSTPILNCYWVGGSAQGLHLVITSTQECCEGPRPGSKSVIKSAKDGTCCRA